LFSGAQALPSSVDLRQWASLVEDQGNLGSVTDGNAGAGILYYFWLVEYSKEIELRIKGQFVNSYVTPHSFRNFPGLP
jgi:hypothetical protein